MRPADYVHTNKYIENLNWDRSILLQVYILSKNMTTLKQVGEYQRTILYSRNKNAPVNQLLKEPNHYTKA